jgi:hypothetical protein
MSAIQVTIHGTGSAVCSLTEKEGDGLTVSFDDGTVQQQFLSWKAFRQLLAMKTANGKKQPPTAIALAPDGAA